MSAVKAIAKVGAVTLTALSLFAPSAAHSAPDIGALIAACTEGGGSLEQRAGKIKALGYSAIKPNGKMWVQGQVAHIAMSELEFGGEDIRGTYKSFQQSADNNDLFRDDIEVYAFADAANTVHISLSAPEGNDPGCSFAFARGITGLQIPLRVRKTWEDDAGTYTDYRISGGRYATISVLGAPWSNWIKGRQLVSAFMVVSR